MFRNQSARLLESEGRQRRYREERASARKGAASLQCRSPQRACCAALHAERQWGKCAATSAQARTPSSAHPRTEEKVWGCGGGSVGVCAGRGWGTLLLLLPAKRARFAAGDPRAVTRSSRIQWYNAQHRRQEIYVAGSVGRQKAGGTMQQVRNVGTQRHAVPVQPLQSAVQRTVLPVLARQRLRGRARVRRTRARQKEEGGTGTRKKKNAKGNRRGIPQQTLQEKFTKVAAVRAQVLTAASARKNPPRPQDGAYRVGGSRVEEQVGMRSRRLKNTVRPHSRAAAVPYGRLLVPNAAAELKVDCA